MDKTKSTKEELPTQLLASCMLYMAQLLPLGYAYPYLITVADLLYVHNAVEWYESTGR